MNERLNGVMVDDWQMVESSDGVVRQAEEDFREAYRELGALDSSATKEAREEAWRKIDKMRSALEDAQQLQAQCLRVSEAHFDANPRAYVEQALADAAVDEIEIHLAQGSLE
jgi:uncharacterized membrane protein